MSVTAQDLVADAKARPGILNFASGGEGGINQLASELLKQRMGTEPQSAKTAAPEVGASDESDLA